MKDIFLLYLPCIYQLYKYFYQFFKKNALFSTMIHEKLRELRKSRGISQEEMAAGLHKSQNAYSLIELGKSKLDAELVPEVCRILNVTPIDLFSNNNTSFTFNDKVENGYATYIQTVNSTNMETLNLLKIELEEKNSTIKSLLHLLNSSS